MINRRMVSVLFGLARWTWKRSKAVTVYSGNSLAGSINQPLKSVRMHSQHSEYVALSHQARYAIPMLTKVQEILTKHKSLVAHYLGINFDLFFSRYNTVLMQSESYVTKRQSIKLLGEVLLDRANYNVMTAYVDRGEHLKLCMNLLKDDRK